MEPPPFVTSSHTVPGFAYVGGDLSPRYSFHDIIGVTKATPSRVGNGPFVGELGGIRSEIYCEEKGRTKGFSQIEREIYNLAELQHSEDEFYSGILIRIDGKEYGTTTGRPRRIGIFDEFRLNNRCIENGITQLFVTKVDRLVDYARTALWKGGIPIITGYNLNGQPIDYIPSSAQELRQVKPDVEVIPWSMDDISDIINPQDFPDEIIEFINRVHRKTRTRVAGIGVGPKPDQMIYID